MGVVDVKQTQEHELTLEWESSASNDMIADATLALITGIDKSPASVKCKVSFYAGVIFNGSLHNPLVTSHAHSHSHEHSHEHAHPHADPESETSSVMRIQRLAMFLEAHFGEVELHMPDVAEDDREQGEDDHEPSLLVRLDEADARIHLLSLVRFF